MGPFFPLHQILPVSALIISDQVTCPSVNQPPLPRRRDSVCSILRYMSTPGQTARAKDSGGGLKKIEEAFAERQGSGCWLQNPDLHTKFKQTDLLHWNHRITESQNPGKQTEWSRPVVLSIWTWTPGGFWDLPCTCQDRVTPRHCSGTEGSCTSATGYKFI